MNENRNANLQIILRNGDRLFFDVSEKGFQFAEKIDSPHKKLKKNLSNIIAYNIETDKFLSIFESNQ